MKGGGEMLDFFVFTLFYRFNKRMMQTFYIIIKNLKSNP